jgi:hypothetical protein
MALDVVAAAAVVLVPAAGTVIVDEPIMITPPVLSTDTVDPSVMVISLPGASVMPLTTTVPDGAGTIVAPLTISGGAVVCA